MDAIRLYSAQVPDQVKKVVRTLIKGSKEDVEDFLPIELGKIGRNAEECLKLAEKVEKKFEYVMDLTGELLEVSSAAKGYYQKEQEEAKKKRDIALAKEKAAREQLRQTKEQQEKLEKQVNEAKRGFENALDSMPSGMELVGMQFVETLTNVVANTASTVLPMMATRGMQTAVPLAAASAQDLEVEPGIEQTLPDVPMAAAFTEGNQLKNLIIELSENLSTASKDPEDGEGSGDDKPDLSGKLQDTRLMMEYLQKDLLSSKESPTNKQLLALLNKGLNICKEGEALAEQLSFSPNQIEKIAKQASKLTLEVRKFCTKVQANMKGTPFYTRPPRQAKTASSANSASSSAAKVAAENARFKIAEAKGLLERQEIRYDQTCSQMKEDNNKLRDVLQELAEFSPEKIANFDEIRETLARGLKALASLREKWQKLVEFFQFVTNMIKVCQKESLSSFAEYAKVGQKRALANGYAGTDFMRDLIYEQVNQANTTSYVVWSISHMYVEISHKYLMSRLASLAHLIALDPEKERHEINKKRNELMEDCQEAQDEIKKFVLESQEQFHKKVAKRIQQIETELVKALPSEDPAKIKEIEGTVNKAIKEADDEFSEDKF